MGQSLPLATSSRFTKAKKTVYVLAFLVSLLLLFYCAYIFITQQSFARLQNIDFISHSHILIPAMLLYLAIQPTAAWSWQKLLAACGEKQPLLSLTLILGITQFGKYIPGNVGQHIGRYALSLRQNINTTNFALTTMFEIGLTLFAGILFCLALLPMIGSRPLLDVNFNVPYSALFFLLLYLFVFSLLVFFGKQFLQRQNKKIHWQAAIIPTTVIYFFHFIFLSIGFYFCVQIAHPSPPSFAWCAFSFSAAWVVGFLSPGLPAGLGTREALLLFFLGQQLPLSDAALIAAIHRAFSFLGDCLCFVVCLLFSLYKKPLFLRKAKS